jgi:hypothetical protein
VGAEDVVAEFQQRPVAWLAPDIVRSPGGGGGGAWRCAAYRSACAS